MSIDPVARLVALHSDSQNEAIDLLSQAETVSKAKFVSMIEDAIGGFIEEIEHAICTNRSEVNLSVQAAELIAVALKTRRRMSGRPPLSKNERFRRNTLIDYARKRKAGLEATGMTAGEAAEQAASEVAEIGKRAGDKASVEFILDQMKRSVKKHGG